MGHRPGGGPECAGRAATDRGRRGRRCGHDGARPGAGRVSDAVPACACRRCAPTAVREDWRTTGAGSSSRRDRLRAQLSAEVRSVARDIIGRHGVEALTLAAVARAVGVTPAALHRYFTGLPDIVRQAARDIVGELCRELRDVVEAEGDFAARLVEPSRAFRRWELAHRQEFGLLFGNHGSVAGGACGEVAGERVRRLAGVRGPVFTHLWAARPYPLPAEEDHFAPLVTDQEPMFELLMQDLTARTGPAADHRPPRTNAGR
ncbi:TetR/AcrR family transcriptional regulator [Kitasatospora griseola]|uniref:TetR/AcrR family transcriptional regulator n=1 Tax=Kitasatospora griseola TaxID=2064 RepID=UPI003651A74E